MQLATICSLEWSWSCSLGLQAVDPTTAAAGSAVTGIVGGIAALAVAGPVLGLAAAGLAGGAALNYFSADKVCRAPAISPSLPLLLTEDRIRQTLICKERTGMMCRSAAMALANEDSFLQDFMKRKSRLEM